MTVSDIPPQLILHIGQLLARSDLNALVQANKSFNQNLNSSLWQRNADLVLLWAAENSKTKAARKKPSNSERISMPNIRTPMTNWLDRGRFCMRRPCTTKAALLPSS